MPATNTTFSTPDTPDGPRRSRPGRRDAGTPRHASRLARITRAVLIALVAASLLSGLAGGLLRAGMALPALSHASWAAQATGLHAALMICGFLGTVIGVERAVALCSPWAFGAPLASGLGAATLLAGHADWGALLFVLAAAIFALVNAVIVRKQAAPHTVLLLVAALVWLAGNLHFSWQGVGDASAAAWFAFLVLTIAAERLEMSRLMRRSPVAQPLLACVVALLLVGALLAWWHAVPGEVLYGLGLLALALWLATFDIARHTVQARGLSRYMAVCLLGGYAWLGVAGGCWATYALGQPVRDAALHALGLGFIVSMVMGHAPVILPAVAGIKVHFDARFYLPLLVLHASLLLRLLIGTRHPEARALGAALNAAAIGLFALTMVSAAWSWRRRHPAR